MDVTECRLRLEAEEMSEVVASQSPRSPSRRHAHLGDAVRWDHCTRGAGSGLYSACLSVGGVRMSTKSRQSEEMWEKESNSRTRAGSSEQSASIPVQPGIRNPVESRLHDVPEWADTDHSDGETLTVAFTCRDMLTYLVQRVMTCGGFPSDRVLDVFPCWLLVTFVPEVLTR